MSSSLSVSCFQLSLALLLSTYCSGPQQARLSNTKAGTPLMGCLWMMIRTARCVWLRARLSLQPDWMLTSRRGNTAGFTEGLTGLSTLYKGLTLWKCSIQYLTDSKKPSRGIKRSGCIYLVSVVPEVGLLAILALVRQRQENQKFKASLGYKMSPAWAI